MDLKDTPFDLHAEGPLKRRLLKDRLFRQLMTFGGVSVIIAISAIFFYLGSVVLPLMLPASLEEVRQYARPGAPQERTVHLAAEELSEVGVRWSDGGQIALFDLRSGAAIREQRMAVPPGAQITSFAAGYPQEYAVAYGLDDGRALLARQAFEVTFPGDRRVVTARIEHPLGEAPFVVDEKGAPLRMLAIQHNERDGTAAAALTADGRLVLRALTTRKNLITGQVSTESSGAELPAIEGEVSHIVLDVRQRELYVVHGGRYITQFDIADKTAPRLVQRIEAAPAGDRITAVAALSGGYSVIVGTARGRLEQWFPVRDAENVARLTRIRDFRAMPGSVSVITPEYYRKGFIAGDERGNVGIYYATSRRNLLTTRMSEAPIRVAAIAPRANTMMIEDAGGGLRVAAIDNDHPEVSWHSLWEPVWYEGYATPELVWQSSAATSDFEPKLSLSPLTFGTLKAAFYAMMVAIPLAILGAIFTAYFMSPRMRTAVKPSIEIMEALPTVILGFLAGLWLAPYVENNLAGTLSIVVTVPLCIMAASYSWHRLPAALTQRIPAGWEAAMLIPVVAFGVWLALGLGPPVEAAYFGGDLPHWFNERGITYEQRNSLVVGIAMGFAVTPTIFSIAEDAIFSVPRHLTSGSLALGATPWQTLTGVVLLTASPGIFSAVMIGMGRAVGETMIVLMATGNTAVLDLSIFTGFRTLAANIGVEMPEAAVDSTHYRVLFLSALVLFVFTFFVNTIAEIVRQHLRVRYSSM
jgi:phosphate transport system permease protein